MDCHRGTSWSDEATRTADRERKVITHEKLKSLYFYNPESGTFTRLRNIEKKWKVGTIAGQKKTSGYIRLIVNSEPYYAHRLAWLYVYGCWPKDEIDHINGDKADNRIVNLREATRSVNGQNQRKAMCDSKTGFLGVSKNRNKWKAGIVVNNKNIHIGTFDTPELAHEAYVVTKRKLHAGCTI